MNRYLLALMAAAALAAGCSESTPTPLAEGGSGGGGSGGDGGTGGSGGTAPRSCADLELPGALADGAWDTSFSIGGLTGEDGIGPRVLDLALDADGDLLATGYFRWSGAQPVPPFVRLNGAQWESARAEWEIEPAAGGYSAMAVGPKGTALATSSLLEPHDGELLLDTGDGLVQIGHFEGQIRSMVWLGDELWVAGPFALDEGGSPGLSIWDGAAWKSAPGGGPDGAAYELLVEGSTILVGGEFQHIGGVAAHAVAAWDGTAWTAYDLGMPATIYALARGAEGELYAGGALFRDPEEKSGGIVRWNGTSWDLLGNGVSAGYEKGVVADLAFFRGELYVNGCFSHVGGNLEDPAAIGSDGLAKWNGEAWEAMVDADDFVWTVWVDPPQNCGNEGPFSVFRMNQQRLLATADRLYVAGSSPGMGSVQSQAISAWDGENWLRLGEGGQGLAGEVEALAVGGPDCAVHALGRYTHVGGAPATSPVLRYRDGWEAVGGAAPEDTECTRVEVDAEGTVYVGCSRFPADGGEPKAQVFTVGDEGWSLAGELDGVLVDMQIDADGNIWIGGGGATGWIARLDGDAFTVIEDGFDSIVWRFALAPAGETGLVASGFFANIDGKPFDRIARWDGEEWHALGDGMNATVTAVEYGTTGIYAATTFEGDPSRAILAKWDGSAWTELVAPGNGIADPIGGSVHTFTTLLERGGKLLATGYVWPTNGERNAFVWDGERFTSIGGGIAAISVDAVALAKDGLWFGGTIAEAGPADARVPTVGVARFKWE